MKKVAIVGSNSKTRGNAPFDDPDTEIWVFNEAPQQEWMQGKRWNVLFQLHKPAVYRSLNNWVVKNHWAWLQQQQGKAIYMQEIDPQVPGSVRYPFEEILKSIPGANLIWLQPPNNPYPARQGWFDLSAAYALALALYLGYQDIEIYGMDLESGTEYKYQLGCWRFWVGIALGMGRNLVVKCESQDFGTDHRYAYDGEIQIGTDYYQARTDVLQRQWTEADRSLHQVKDQVDQAILGFKYDQLASGLIVEYQKANQYCGMYAGALAEAENYARRTDPITRQEFERRAAQAQQDGEGFQAQMYQIGGKTEYVFNIWRQTGKIDALRQFRTFLAQQMEFAYDTGAHLGIYRENLGYLNEYDDLLTAAGGQHTVAALTAEAV